MNFKRKGRHSSSSEGNNGGDSEQSQGQQSGNRYLAQDAQTIDSFTTH